MQTRERRIFLLQVIAGSAVLSAQVSARAAPAGPRPTVAVKESDAYPKSMGFRLKTEDVDKAKYPRHDVKQSCKDCQLYSGEPGEELGPCSFFKRLVPPDGWCRNFKPRKAAA
jgi:hypothetical protein